MLPACYTNPDLAKSALRYVIKHSGEDGEIKRGTGGFSYWAASVYKESDEQLYFFNSISEYLLITKDYAFLNEKCEFYPAENGKQDKVINFLKKYFIYLRDEVGVGSHGLVRILNSDWSDSFLQEYSPNKYLNAESHLNTAMVLAILPKLIDALKQSGNGDAATLIDALENYRAAISTAFFKDFGDRKFAARAYLNNSIKFGLDGVCLEPQGYLLQIPDLSVSRKKEIYEYVKSKNFTPEQIGFRIREKPLWDKRAESEDGAIWYALQYPVLLGVAMFDKSEAKALLKAFSFETSGAKYPNYWMGQWTAADDINSSLSTQEGLYSFWDGGGMKSYFHGYCSHPHTWPLFCYYKLNE
jgi:cellobiose phosphorylase